MKICLHEETQNNSHYTFFQVKKTYDGVREAGASSHKLDAVREGMRALVIRSGVKRALRCKISHPILRPVIKKRVTGNGHFEVETVSGSFQ